MIHTNFQIQADVYANLDSACRAVSHDNAHHPMVNRLRQGRCPTNANNFPIWTKKSHSNLSLRHIWLDKNLHQFHGDNCSWDLLMQKLSTSRCQYHKNLACAEHRHEAFVLVGPVCQKCFAQRVAYGCSERDNA